MQQCRVNKLIIGGNEPARVMGVINCSPESFYANSYIPTELVHKTAVEMVDQGADLIDIGARSTAPNTQAICGSTELSRIDAALKELDGSGITVSVDTLNPWVLDACLRHEIHAINDISGLTSENYTRKVAESKLPAFLMASNSQPGDSVGLTATTGALAKIVERCKAAGIAEYVLDPGIGIWTPFRSVEDDWTLCPAFCGFFAVRPPPPRRYIPEDLYRGPAEPFSGRSSCREPCSNPHAAGAGCVSGPDPRCPRDR